MKRRERIRGMSLLVAAVMLWGCSAQKEAADTYVAYQGYTCQDGSSHIKYGLETENGIRLHCFFQSGSPEYTEDIYELKLSPGEGEKASVEQVIDGQGVDLTASFRKFDFSFYPDRVVMEVERNTDLLAGGTSDNLETGEYTLTASDWKPGSAPAGEKQAETDSLAPWQDRELAAMARAYYQKEANFLAPETECVDNGDGTLTIHLYEMVQDDEETSHTGTSAWYTVDAYGKGKDDVFGNEVKLPELSLAELAEYMGTPSKLTYIQNAEAHREWELTDGAVIAECLQAVKKLEIGEETDERASDTGDTLIFTFADGSVWRLEFEAGNLRRNEKYYKTEGWNRIRLLLKDELEGEGML